MNHNLDTKLNSAPQQNEQAPRSARTPPTGRASRPGRFSHLLEDFGIKRDDSPKALVRSGKSVTFSGIVFFDQFGNRIDLDNSSSFKRTEEGHRGRRPQRMDAHLNREMALSENRGAALFIPGFKKRAAEHLLLTDQLRMRILSGEVETPGNQSDILKKRLGDERKVAEEHDPQLWLQEFRTHMASSPEGDAARLMAQAAAMTDGEKQMKRARAELKNPLEKEVQPFAPPRITKQGKSVQTSSEAVKQVTEKADSAAVTGKPKTINVQSNVLTNTSKLPEFKGEVGEKPSLDIPAKKPQSMRVDLSRKPSVNLLTQLRSKVGPARSTAWSDARTVRGNDGELRRSSLTTPKAVSHVTVERTAETASDQSKLQTGQTASPQTRAGRPATRPDTVLADRSLSRTARNTKPRAVAMGAVTSPISAATKTSDQAAAGEAAVRGKARSRIASMERSGWHVHAPKVNGRKSSEARGGRPNSTHETKPNKLGSAKTSRQKTRSVAPDDAVAIKPGAGKGSIVSNLGSTRALSTGRRTSSSAQGLQNLNTVMQNISSQAKILKGDGVIKLQVPLKPARLGNVLLNVIRSNGKYIVKLTTERLDALNTLEQHLPAIREHLANQGINVERIEVETGNARPTDSTGEQQRREAAERQQEHQRSAGRNRRSQSDRTTDSNPRNDPRSGPLRTGLNTVEYLAE